MANEQQINLKIEEYQQERLKNLNEKIENDEKFKNELLGLKTIDKKQKYCCEHGIDVTADDLSLIFKMASDFIENINENDLGNVSGGIKVSKEQIEEFFKNNYGKLAVSAYFIWELVGHIVAGQKGKPVTPLTALEYACGRNRRNREACNRARAESDGVIMPLICEDIPSEF